MFAFLRGKVAAVFNAAKGEPAQVWLDVAGAGYKLHVDAGTAKSLRRGDDALFYISQSSAMYGGETTLYGFATTQDRDLFELIRSMSAVGAKKAIEYFEKVKTRSVDRFLEAIVRGDGKLLSTHFGLSAKTSAKMITQLKEQAEQSLSLWHAGAYEAPAGTAGEDGSLGRDGAWINGLLWQQTRDALMSLGFDARSSESALNAVLAKMPKKEHAASAPEDLLRQALKELQLVR